MAEKTIYSVCKELQSYYESCKRAYTKDEKQYWIYNGKSQALLDIIANVPNFAWESPDVTRIKMNGEEFVKVGK